MAAMTGLNTLSGHLLSAVLENLENELDRKSWRITCRHLYGLQVDSQRTVKLLNAAILQQVLLKYPRLEHLDLSSCPMVTDRDLVCISELARDHLVSLSMVRIGTYTVAGITALSKGCSSLLYMDLSCSCISDLELATLSQLTKLKTLNLMGCYKISDAGLGCLSAGCKLLEVITLKGCVGITDTGVHLLATNCRNLNTIDVSYTEVYMYTSMRTHTVVNLYVQITDVGTLANLSSLTRLNMSACSNIVYAGLSCISTSLLELDLSRCRNVTNTTIISLAARRLEELNLSYCTPISNELLQAIGKLNRLQVLKLAGCDVFGNGLRFIAAGCTQLVELSLSKCRGVTDTGIISILSGCKYFKRIDLTCCRELTQSAINSLRDLTSLKIESCNVLTENSIAILSRRCSGSLEVLDLTDCSVSDTGMEFIEQCGKLRSLKLGFCNISDRGISHIGNSCSNMVELDLYRSEMIGDDGVASIASGCSKLQVLNLSYCTGISDASIVSVSVLKQLRQLEVRGCKRIKLVGLEKALPVFRSLVEFDLKRCSIGDPGMNTIVVHFPNVQQLNLSYCPVTDRGFGRISRLRCLQNVRLVHVSVSVECMVEALLRCPCLKKVKMLSDMKSDIDPHKFEQRGCRLRWMEKPG